MLNAICWCCLVLHRRAASALAAHAQDAAHAYDLVLVGYGILGVKQALMILSPHAEVAAHAHYLELMMHVLKVLCSSLHAKEPALTLTRLQYHSVKLW
ncbi:hypothetical protein DUNSADRAFT_12685 [Dunaliella salina]|uniref:Secreted protein n=1 Tax=Dunaliella salina TaxID=3046 RepID=A0ABQ7GAV7_DUNSA|nr:hypothetical protein DUNSADRAFT_12685 [Dunaliella salina]|eukprot:KAF5831739.1 hypothetical protein DUNSADRAFT_12685 [Dunaliella salina]